MARKAFFTSSWIPSLLALATDAGHLIMGYYKQDHDVIRKADDSPVTAADHAADLLIIQKLATLEPAFPVVSEEGAKPDIADASHFWLVDPLDGTRSFIRGSGYFTVNIGLINEDREPVLGIIYDPVHEVMYWGSPEGAFRQTKGKAPEAISCRIAQKDKITAFVSHSHSNEATENWLVKHAVAERIPCASSIKFCFLAEGKADCYPRFGPTSEWDTAAGHAILNAAGGSVEMPDGQPFRYGKAGFRNGNFIAWGRRQA